MPGAGSGVSAPLQPMAVTTLMVGTSAFCAGTSIGVAPIVAASGSVDVPPQPGSAATVSAEAHGPAER